MKLQNTIRSFSIVLILALLALRLPFIVSAAPGDLDASFSPSITHVDTIRMETVVVQPDGKILIGGYFGFINGVERNSIARLNPDGSLDTTFSSPLTTGTVNAIALQADGRILVGGNFYINQTDRKFLVRLESDGTINSEFNDLASPNFDTNSNTVFAILPDPDGSFLIGGSFYFVANTLVSGLARILPDDSLGTALGTAVGLQNDISGILRVQGISMQSDGKVVIGGQFVSNSTNPSKKGLMRINPDNVIDPLFTATGTDPGERIYSVIVQPNGKILVGGNFSAINGGFTPRLARLNSDGSVDSNHAPINLFLSGAIFSMALQPDGRLLIGGALGEINSQSRNGIARLNPDFSLDSFYPNPGGVSGQVWSIAPQADGNVLIGGFFTTVAGISRPYLARLIDDGLPPPSPTPTFTPTAAPTATNTATPTNTPTATATATNAPTPAVTPTPVFIAAPSNLRTTAITVSRIDLAWNDNSNNETFFEVQRCQSAGKCTVFFTHAILGSNATTFSDTGLATATTYVYRVRGTRSDGASAFSNTLKVKTLRR